MSGMGGARKSGRSDTLVNSRRTVGLAGLERRQWPVRRIRHATDFRNSL